MLRKKILFLVTFVVMLLLLTFPVFAESPETNEIVVNTGSITDCTVGVLFNGGWYHKPEKVNGSEKTFIVDPGKEYEIRVSKNGMSYSKSDVAAGSIVTVPVTTITVNTGEINDCAIGVLQNGTWVYQPKKIEGSTTSFDVFDNGKEYEVRVSKGGMNITKKATDSVTVETYAINIPEGLKNVGLVQNGSWVYTNITSPSTIYVFKNGMTAEFRYTYDGVEKKVSFIMDGTSPTF
ncbi:MAG: hypothetical protein GX022_00645 [Clostridiaceae bacterium]|nr:hypothetical protein [Clostridiaceae bacterium]